ncbi:hypothetical protein JC2156_04380 [Weissella koreensis KCTC 3621]|uniref:phage scaffolding protein n=1 Tax=Weissella koreensis TaxID=165096 RepID=UPI00026F3653|nr:phage scaffolding protein [Weissella koreensis]EJF33728.1 hypothetical protein JC2156_05420 [Weissella koreensis KCTC 3621]EJF34130.1 hypothetical protein JC2156_04380 [Weissella koreensis KCTC 3621]
MKRDFLKNLGITDDETIKQIMDANGQDIETAKTGSQSDYDAVVAERDGLQEQLKSRDKDMKDLKKQAGDNEELSNKYTELQAKYDEDTQSLAADLSKTKLNSAVSEALANTKARDVNDIKALLDMDQVALGEDGKLSGLDEQIEGLQETKSYLFEGEVIAKGGNPADGKGGKGATDLMAEALGIIEQK